MSSSQILTKLLKKYTAYKAQKAQYDNLLHDFRVALREALKTQKPIVIANALGFRQSFINKHIERLEQEERSAK